jgi:ligand-binding sensor domain-containing protein
MMRILALYIITLFFSAAYAQQPFVRDLWLNETNTPVRVNDLLQDNKGYVWLATDAGVYRFNGRDLLAVEDKVQKPATALAAMMGDVWVGYNDGTLGKVKGTQILVNTASTTTISSSITSLYSPGGDVLCVGTQDKGLAIMCNGRTFFIDQDKGLTDNFVYNVQPAGNRLLVGTDKGINIISVSKTGIDIQSVTTTNGLPDNIVRVIKRVPGTTTYWVGMQQGGIALLDAGTGKVKLTRSLKTWQWGQVNDILVMNERHAWVGTDDGYLLDVRIHADSIKYTASTIGGKRINKLHCGRSGMLWSATNQGLTMSTSAYMNFLPLGQPYNLSTLTAMACDKDNNLWFSQEAALYTMPVNGSSTPRQVAKLPVDIKCLYADAYGNIWIGTMGQGLWLLNRGGSLTAIHGIAQLENETVLDISGSQGRLWVSGLNGVEELAYTTDNGRQVALVQLHNKYSGIGSDYVYQVYPDKKGRVWMATDGGGVSYYQNGTYKKWDTTDGMPAKVAYTVTEDAGNAIWVGTLENGLYKYNNQKWQSVGKEQGLQDIQIATTAANNTGQVMIVHSKGIDVWYPRSGQFRSYPRRQLGIDSLSDVLKLFANDREGNVYIPFQSGFIVFGNVDTSFDIRPLVNINTVSAAFKEVTDGRNRFSHSENFLSFRYEGINFANPERLHYRYKLEGYNDNWTVTNDESATFPQLPDGDYTFRVQASLNNNFNSAGESVYRFVVEKPYWKNVWFILGSTVLLLGMGYIYMRVRERNLRKMSQLQGERMKFEYEHLKSQVNPHFLFNSLNTLTSLIDEDQDAAMTYTSRLSDLYRNMLAYRDRDLVLLAEEWEILDNYMYIQRTRFGEALRLVAHVPEEYMQSRRIVPLALQLLVENAIKHNVVSRSKPLTITITVTEDEITISNPIQPKYSKEKGAGLGLINIRKRYGLLSKKSITFGQENDHYIVKLPLL